MAPMFRIAMKVTEEHVLHTRTRGRCNIKFR